MTLNHNYHNHTANERHRDIKKTDGSAVMSGLGFALGRTGNGNFPRNGQKTETGRTGKCKPRLNSEIE